MSKDDFTIVNIFEILRNRNIQKPLEGVSQGLWWIDRLHQHEKDCDIRLYLNENNLITFKVLYIILRITTDNMSTTLSKVPEKQGM